MGNNVYEKVTELIIARLESGEIPWRQPWSGAINYETRRPYRGINRMLLPKGGEYLTFLQAKKRGGKVKRGAKGHLVVFFKPWEVEDEKTGDTKKIPLLKTYHVFHLDDIEGIPSKLKKGEGGDIADAETIVQEYTRAPEIQYLDQPRAFYSPSADKITMPPRSTFFSPAGLYETLFHEMIHSTGHKSRLQRFEEGQKIGGFGSAEYSREELIAEIGAAFLLDEAGILSQTIDNNAAYVRGWLSALKNDVSMIVWAAGRAQRAADFIRNREEQKAEPGENEEKAS